jgi:hypothetical protein
MSETLHAAWTILPAFTAETHATLLRAGIDLYRAPAYRERPTQVRLELMAADAQDAVARIVAAVAEDGRSLDPVTGFEAPPRPVAPRHRAARPALAGTT